MSRFTKRTLLLATLSLLPLQAQADDPLYITVTKGYVPLDDVGSAVTVVTADELERREVRTLPEALQTVPGLHVVQSGPAGSLTSVFMRGSNSSQVLVLINGRPVGDPSSGNGAFAFNHIPLASVERIEVLRGPSSSLYGSRAMGGVINIVTRAGEGPMSYSGLVEVGTRNSLTTTANANGRVEGIGIDTTLSRFYSDGFSITPERLRGAADDEADGYRNLSGSLALDAVLSDTLSVRGSGSVVDTRLDTDPFLEDPNAEENTLTYYADAAIIGNFFEGRWKPTLSFGYSNYWRNDTNIALDPFDTESDVVNSGARFNAELQNDVKIDERNSITIGGVFEHELFDSEGFSNFGGFIINEDSHANRNTWGLYALHRFDLDGRLIVNSSVRLDSVEGIGEAATFSVTPLYKIVSTGTTLKGSVGTGFKAPSLYELYGF